MKTRYRIYSKKVGATVFYIVRYKLWWFPVCWFGLTRPMFDYDLEETNHELCVFKTLDSAKSFIQSGEKDTYSFVSKSPFNLVEEMQK